MHKRLGCSVQDFDHLMLEHEGLNIALTKNSPIFPRIRPCATTP